MNDSVFEHAKILLVRSKRNSYPYPLKRNGKMENKLMKRDNKSDHRKLNPYPG